MLADGVRIEHLGNLWASYSALSGETQLLNHEAASVLELLSNGPIDSAAVTQTLAADSQSCVDGVREALHHTWDQLLAAGLVEIQ